MPRLEIKRENCIHGYWGYPMGIEGPEWLDHAQMPLRYISNREGWQVNSHQLSRLSVSFTPDKPEQVNGHGVLGTVVIVYELRQVQRK